jgi:hypothetical protein
LSDKVAGSTSRRGFLARVGGGVMAVAGAKTAGSLVKPGEAEAYHFCGHIYTTDSCPHPTGIPRIDSRGYPLRARDGKRVDDLGRVVDRDGSPVDDDGNRLTDPDGRPLPRASRTPVCGGKVRKLVDCCAYTRRRINGDGALTGYCYSGRKVFCVMYFQTKVPC